MAEHQDRAQGPQNALPRVSRVFDCINMDNSSDKILVQLGMAANLLGKGFESQQLYQVTENERGFVTVPLPCIRWER